MRVLLKGGAGAIPAGGVDTTPLPGGPGIVPPALRLGCGVLRLSVNDGVGNARILSLT
jgi:hypothetical protein